jgi:hypothetical protein
MADRRADARLSSLRSPDHLREAVGALDESSRRLIELSLRRGPPDRALAALAGIPEEELAERRTLILALLGDARGIEEGSFVESAPDGRARPADVEARRPPFRIRRFLRDNGLSLFFLGLFVLALAFQAVAGHIEYNAQQVEHHEATVSLWRYLISSDFGSSVLQNWQSEWLQFVLFIVATIWLFQRGSSESKDPEKEGPGARPNELSGGDGNSPSWARAGAVRRWLYSNSLLALFVAIFLTTWVVQSLNGWSQFNSDQLEHHSRGISWIHYLGTADFWNATLQNWQSEFLAVGAMAVFSVYLRQRGSAQSKLVGASHEATGAVD